MENTKKKTVAIAICAVAAIAVAVAVWLNGKKTHQYTDAIPDDSKAVAVLRPAAAVKQLGIEDLVDETLQDSWLKESGLDLTSDIYGFVAGDNTAGAVMKIKDASALEKTLASKGMETSSKRGLHWAEADKWICCYDDERLLAALIGDKGDEDRLLGNMYKLMNKDTRPAALLASLDNDAPLAVISSGSVLQNTVRTIAGDFPTAVDLSKVLLSTKVEIHDKTITLDTGISTADKKIKEALKGLHSFMLPINKVGDLFLPPSPTFWMAINVDGGKLAGALQESEEAKAWLQMAQAFIDTKGMMESVDGRMTFSLDNTTAMGADYLFAAKVNDDSFARTGDTASDLAALALQATKKSPTEYTLQAAGVPLSFGVRDKLLYVTNNAALVGDTKERTLHKEVMDKEAEIGKYRLYASLDLKKAMKAAAPSLLMIGADLSVYAALDKMERLDIMSDMDTKLRLNLTLDTPVKDVAKDLMKK